jgi:transcriptional regulator with XRE-family HTH domain
MAKKFANGDGDARSVIARIEALREEQGLSQAEFGRRLFPKAPATWHKIAAGKENRQLRAEHVAAAALILRTKPYILYGGSEPAPEAPESRIVLDSLPAGMVRDLKNLAADDLRTLENYIQKVLVDHIQAKKNQSDE